MNNKHYLSMDITNTCNSSCRMCYFSLPGFKSKGRNMSLEEFDACVKKLRNDAGVLALSCAFEPLLHPKIEHVLRRSASLVNWKKRLNSNGILLNMNIIKAIMDSGLNDLIISIDAADEELNRRIRGNNRSPQIQKQMKSLSRLKKAAGLTIPMCSIRTTLLKANLHELPKMVELAARIGAEKYVVKHLLPIEGCEWEGEPMSKQSCLLEPERTEKVFSETRKRAKELGVELELPSPYPKEESQLKRRCPYVESGFHIFPDGTCYPCVWLTVKESYGNIFADTFEQIMQNALNNPLNAAFKKGILPKKCDSCLRDSQTVGIKNEDDAIERLS